MTCLLLAAYLAANTVGGLFHSHDDHEHAIACHHGASAHDESHACALGDQDHEYDAAGLTRSTDGKSPHDDDCAVCRFTGLQTMPVAIVALTALGELSAELAVVHARGPVSRIARTVHSRAPPCWG